MDEWKGKDREGRRGGWKYGRTDLLVVEEHLVPREPVPLELELLEKPSGGLDGAEGEVVVHEWFDWITSRQDVEAGMKEVGRTRRALRIRNRDDAR